MTLTIYIITRFTRFLFQYLMNMRFKIIQGCAVCTHRCGKLFHLDERWTAELDGNTMRIQYACNQSLNIHTSETSAQAHLVRSPDPNDLQNSVQEDFLVHQKYTHDNMKFRAVFMSHVVKNVRSHTWTNPLKIHRSGMIPEGSRVTSKI